MRGKECGSHGSLASARAPHAATLTPTAFLCRGDAYRQHRSLNSEGGLERVETTSSHDFNTAFLSEEGLTV